MKWKGPEAPKGTFRAFFEREGVKEAPCRQNGNCGREMIRTVIFDVDDTLYSFHDADVHAKDALIAYTKEMFGWSGEEFMRRHKAAFEEILGVCGRSGGLRTRLIRYQTILERAGKPIHPHAMRMDGIYWETLLAGIVPNEGVPEFMAYLKDRGIRIGIGSDAIALQQFSKLEKLGLMQFVDFMVTSEEVDIEKPAAHFFDRCLEKSGCLREEIVFIGDRFDKDYTGAANAGFHAVLFDTKGRAPEEAEAVLHSFRDAAALIAQWE